VNVRRGKGGAGAVGVQMVERRKEKKSLVDSDHKEECERSARLEGCVTNASLVREGSPRPFGIPGGGAIR